jgi:mannose-6-phosphate isomerase-like protein (cupin superfamily)
MPRPFRRVVTGHNAQGKSIFVMDGPAPAVHSRGTGATSSTEFWVTSATPADNAGNADPTMTEERRLPPPKNGTIFRVVEYPPDSQRVAVLRAPDASHDAKSEGYVRDLKNARHPGFHKTDSIDYAIVLSGEIYALMDEGEVLLKAGDVLIQRGTNHAWSNRTEQPCCIAFVLIDAKPV